MPYRIDLWACRRALLRLPGKNDQERIGHLARQVGLGPASILRLFAGRPLRSAHAVAIVTKLGLGPSRLPPWSSGSA